MQWLTMQRDTTTWVTKCDQLLVICCIALFFFPMFLVAAFETGSVTVMNILWHFGWRSSGTIRGFLV